MNHAISDYGSHHVIHRISPMTRRTMSTCALLQQRSHTDAMWSVGWATYMIYQFYFTPFTRITYSKPSAEYRHFHVIYFIRSPSFTISSPSLFHRFLLRIFRLFFYSVRLCWDKQKILWTHILSYNSMCATTKHNQNDCCVPVRVCMYVYVCVYCVRVSECSMYE